MVNTLLFRFALAGPSRGELVLRAEKLLREATDCCAPTKPFRYPLSFGECGQTPISWRVTIRNA